MENKPESANSTSKLDTWPRRRRMMWLILWFCVGVIVYSLTKDPKYGEVSIEMSFIIIGLTVLAYVFGAVLDDNAVNIFKRR